MRINLAASSFALLFLASSLSSQTSAPAQKKTETIPPPRVNIERRDGRPLKTEDDSSKGANLRIDTNLVLIPVSVTDPLNRFVTGLERENFKIFEDKVEQTIAQFASEDAPLSVGLVFDTSNSMGAKLQKSRQAAAQFFKTANPDDEFFLVQFNDRPELVVPFTPNSEEPSPRPKAAPPSSMASTSP